MPKRGPRNADDEERMSASEVDKLANDCVQYLLIRAQKKLPIKRLDISKAVFQNAGRVSLAHCFDEVKRRLDNVFGIRLVEADDSFILVSNLSTSGLTETGLNRQRSRDFYLELGLLLPVLAVVFMSGGTLIEEELVRFLERLGWDWESKRALPIKSHQQLTLKKLVTERWTRQCYLKRQKTSAATENPVYEYSWGLRAQHEMSKMDVLKFVSEIYGEDYKPESWKQHYEQALEEQGVRRPQPVPTQVIDEGMDEDTDEGGVEVLDNSD